MEGILDAHPWYVLRAERGEEVLGALGEFCAARGIHGGTFTAIGAIEDATMSWYDVDRKEYTDTRLREKLEIATLVGNVALLNESVIIHAHGVFTDSAAYARGGHVKALVTGATCEVTLRAFTTLCRAHSTEVGLNLLHGDS